MKQSLPPRRLKIIIVLLASNIVTCLGAILVTRAFDFSNTNTNCLANWGSVEGQFEDIREAHVQELDHKSPQDEASLYRIHEDNARFLVHYPRFNRRMGMNKNRAVTLFCWAVAADTYHDDGVDIPVDPEVWQAFLADGPKGLPIYWQLRESLIRAGAGKGLIRGDDSMFHLTGHKPPPYKMGPLPRPYQPLPGEVTPS